MYFLTCKIVIDSEITITVVADKMVTIQPKHLIYNETDKKILPVQIPSHKEKVQQERYIFLHNHRNTPSSVYHGEHCLYQESIACSHLLQQKQ
jgi:hypothetical protein